MKRTLILALAVLFAALPVAGHAQLKEKILEIFASDTTHVETVDSLSAANIRRELEEARLGQQSLRLELEQLRLQAAAGDSIRRARQRQRIDSLRHHTVGAPVVVEGDTLFSIYAKRGGLLPRTRAEMNVRAIEALGRRLRLKPDSVRVEESDIVSDLVYEDQVLVSFTDLDALWAGVPRQELAEQTRAVVVDKLGVMHERHGWMELIWRSVYFLLVLVGQYIFFRFTNWLYRKAKRRICRYGHARFKSVLIQNYELLDIRKQVRLLIFVANIVRYIVVLLQLLVSIPLLFAIFPSTERLAYQIVAYIWAPVRGILLGMLNYIPDLFTILIIWLVIRYVVKGVRYLATEIHSGKLKINGFYPDWAIPTFHIVRFLLYAFMIAMIYPYLPGSDSGVFQGISVFVGLIISLGSSTVVANIIAGLVITYMRPFKLGDRIKLNETVGKVIEKTAFVTRLRTPKNEVVTIPNSFVMSSHTVNYSASARKFGLIIHSEVTIGYDAPWRQVHQLLIDAALATPGVEADPIPFVLETSLKDYYPVYQINAYIRDADQMVHICSAMHQNIQDHFNRAGVEILSPAYTAYRNGNASTIPDEKPGV